VLRISTYKNVFLIEDYYCYFTCVLVVVVEMVYVGKCSCWAKNREIWMQKLSIKLLYII